MFARQKAWGYRGYSWLIFVPSLSPHQPLHCSSRHPLSFSVDFWNHYLSSFLIVKWEQLAHSHQISCQSSSWAHYSPIYHAFICTARSLHSGSPICSSPSAISLKGHLQPRGPVQVKAMPIFPLGASWEWHQSLLHFTVHTLVWAHEYKGKELFKFSWWHQAYQDWSVCRPPAAHWVEHWWMVIQAHRIGVISTRRASWVGLTWLNVADMY